MLKFSCLKSHEFFYFTRTADDVLYTLDKDNRWAPFCKPNRRLRPQNSLKKKTVSLQPEEFGNPEFLSPLYQLAKSPDRSMMVSLSIKLDNDESKEILMREKLRSQVKGWQTHPEKEDFLWQADYHGNDSTRRRRS